VGQDLTTLDLGLPPTSCRRGGQTERQRSSGQFRMGVRRGEIPSQIGLDALTADRVCVARSTFLFKTASMRDCMIQTTGT
jgi:hypothetical protein